MLKKRGYVYADHLATTPVADEVLEAMLPYYKDKFGNPTSLHQFGVDAKKAINRAREQIAQLLNISRPEDIVYTSGAIEANNLAIKGYAKAPGITRRGKHIVVSAIEHHSILHSCKSLEKEGFEITYVQPDQYGIIHPDKLAEAVREDTILVSVGYANREIGTLQDMPALVKAVKEKNPRTVFHSDIAAAVGHTPVDLEGWGVDMASFTGHYFYAPKGVGGLYVKKGVRLKPLIEGGIQEGGRRAGTEPVPEIVGMGAAAELAIKEMDDRVNRLKKLRDKLKKGIEEKIDYIQFTGHPEKRLPNHLSLIVMYIEGEAMLLMLNYKKIYTASGSACVSFALKQSHVLAAIGIDKEASNGSIVFSLGRENSEEDIDYIIEEYPKVIQRLREISPFGPENWDQFAKKADKYKHVR
ncbi:MAG TPA: cysteine desulfurase [Persephonella sp.]|uniref:Cysteine desulfurase IscS n=1 Tax=Persephonella marina (strain DSM 14350 / EX-H1) TaxID=123214 RepID=C0QQA5_PERMH|nr:MULTISPECIES: cysteine desulfurase family protein [Persephonella]ACO04605.1 cysteine desulfurase IscS [Persephonella marina EX-H1]HCB69543.1 cysteine desulfurase [Persephonella sp.]